MDSVRVCTCPGLAPTCQACLTYAAQQPHALLQQPDVLPLSNTVLAARLGVTNVTISRWRRRQQLPTPRVGRPTIGQ